MPTTASAVRTAASSASTPRSIPCPVVQTYVDNQGIRHLKTTRNYDNAKDDVTLTTAREAQFNYYLGANDCIIIGTSSFDFQLVAYDGQCPNCLSEYGGYNYPMTWQDNGLQLHCAKCNRTYDVNNGVVADGAAGRELLRYYAALKWLCGFESRSRH